MVTVVTGESRDPGRGSVDIGPRRRETYTSVPGVRDLPHLEGTCNGGCLVLV